MGFALAVCTMHLQLELKRRWWQAAEDQRHQGCLGFALADFATRLRLGLKWQQRRWQAAADQVVALAAAADWWQINGGGGPVGAGGFFALCPCGLRNALAVWAEAAAAAGSDRSGV